MRHHSPWLLAAALVVASCTSLTVTKVDPYGSGDGIRYSLPQPFVIATPKADGTVDYRVEMLPDESRTYAVSSEAYLASQDLLLKVNRGLLTELKWLNDDSAVATQMATSAGAVETARITAETTAAKAAATKAEELEGKIQEAIVARDQAKSELDLLKGPPKRGTDAEIRTADIAFEKAKAKVQALRKRRNPSLNLADANEAGNFPSANAFPAAFGPVIFRVIETVDAEGKPNGLELRAVEDQRVFDSFFAPEAPDGKAPTPPPKVDKASVVLLASVPSAGAKINIGLTEEIESVSATTVLTEIDTGTPSNDAPAAKKINSKVIELTFKAGAKAAKYRLQFRVKTESKSSLPIKVPVTVVQ